MDFKTLEAALINAQERMFEETCKPFGNYSMSPTLRASATTDNFKIIYGL